MNDSIRKSCDTLLLNRIAKVLFTAALGLSFVILIPAIADNDQGNGHGHGNKNWNKGHNGDHDEHWEGYRYPPGYRKGDRYYYEDGRYYYYGYAPPLYAPPPIYYGPPPSPGVSIFLPLDLRVY